MKTALSLWIAFLLLMSNLVSFPSRTRALTNMPQSESKPLYESITGRPEASPEALWSFLVYLDADNDLDSFGVGDFNEMEAVGSTSQVNILVLWDRRGDNNSRIYYVSKDASRAAVTSPVVLSLGEVNMGSPQTLVDFIQWSAQYYPAENYALVLWNHGSGWKSSASNKGIAWDETSGDDYLTTRELREALETASIEAGVSLALVGFDACLMAMMEVGYETSSFGEIMVASEEVEPGEGWPYDLILQALITTPDMSPAKLSTVIVEEYMNSYGFAGGETMAAVDLSQLSSLSSAISDLALSLTAYASSGEVSSARAATDEFYDESYIDLYDFARNIYNTVSEGSVQDYSQNLMAQISSAVIAESHGQAHNDSYGISIYFPAARVSYLSNYETDLQFTQDTSWDEFLIWFYESIALADDYGDNASQSTPLEVNSTISGVLEQSGDRDYFSFSAQQSEDYTIETRMGTLSDSLLYLYDADGSTLLAFDDDSGERNASRITWTAPASGTYYIQVSAYSSEMTGSYTLTLSTAAPAGDDYGNDAVHSAPLEVNSTISGVLEHVGDMDFFSFLAQQGWGYTLETSLGTLSDSYLYLYNADGSTLLASDDDSGEGNASRITWTAPASGTYYIQVSAYSSEMTGSYTLTLSTAAPAGDDHGNDAVHSAPLEVNSTISGVLEQAGDVDFFSFLARQGWEYIMETRLGTLSDSYLYLYDADGSSLLASDDDSGEGYASWITWTAPSSGVFYIKVKAYSPTMTGSYVLSLLGNVPADITPPPVPNLLSPDNGSSTEDLTPAFLWSKVTDPSGVSYILQIDEGSNFSSPLLAQSDLEGESHTVTSPLAPGTYWWRVGAVDGAGNESPWSNPHSLTVLASTVRTTLTYGWNMFSLPILPDPVQWERQLGDDISPLYIFGYDSTIRNYVPFPAFAQGTSYWTKVSQDTEIEVQGEPVDTSTDFVLPVYEGWNMIGDPFPFQVAWSEVKVRYQEQTVSLEQAHINGWVRQWLYWYDPALSTYQVRGAEDGQLNPFEGYWIKVGVEAELLIPPVL